MKQEPKMIDGIPRRNNMHRLQLEERVLRFALETVEWMPPHEKLTEASNKIQEALDLVADYLELGML